MGIVENTFNNIFEDVLPSKGIIWNEFELAEAYTTFVYSSIYGILAVDGVDARSVATPVTVLYAYTFDVEVVKYIVVSFAFTDKYCKVPELEYIFDEYVIYVDDGRLKYLYMFEVVPDAYVYIYPAVTYSLLFAYGPTTVNKVVKAPVVVFIEHFTILDVVLV